MKRYEYCRAESYIDATAFGYYNLYTPERPDGYYAGQSIRQIGYDLAKEGWKFLFERPSGPFVAYFFRREIEPTDDYYFNEEP